MHEMVESPLLPDGLSGALLRASTGLSLEGGRVTRGSRKCLASHLVVFHTFQVFLLLHT